MKALDRFIWRNPALIYCVKKVFSHRNIVNNPLYKALTLRRARRLARHDPPGYMSVSIETALSCNSKCIMCGHAYRDLRGFMSMDLFRKIIAECEECGISEVCLSVYGEPLVDPYFLERVEYLRQRRINYGFFTNASLLDKSKAEKLLQLGGLVRVNFSVCGFRKEVYEKVMQGLDRDTAYRNVLDFLDLKKKHGKTDLRVAVSTVRTRQVVAELDEFVRFWKKQTGVDMIVVSGLWERAGDKDVRAMGEVGSMHRGSRWMAPCRQLWGGIYVYADGRAAPCCDDADERRLIIGDCTTQSLKEIFESKKLQELRLLHLEDKRSRVEVCKQCFHNSVWFY